MKKTILLLLSILVTLVVTAACGPAAPPTAQEIPPPIEPFASDDIESLPTPTKLAEKSELQQTSNDGAASGIFPAGTENRAVTALGDPNAPVVIVEYSDYQCPFCRRHAQETMPQIQAEYIDTGRVYYVFKDFPIANLHPLAYRLHEAALCAGEVGNTSDYWQAHELFFTKAETFQQNSESAMDAAILAEFETEGLPDIGSCLTNGRFTEEVQQYITEGQSLGVRGTPSFFVNGNLLVGAQPYSTFQGVIEQVERGETVASAAAPPEPETAVVPTPASIEPRALTALGDPNAPVTIIEYSDFQCPFCRRHVLETMPQIKANFIDTGQVYYVFKDFPIESLHPLAYRLHEAALCAGQSNDTETYWQAHDLFFDEAERFQVDSEEAIDAAILTAFADAGLPDVTQCLANNENAAVVQETLSEGLRLGVTGTPAFYINGYPISGAQPYDLFEYAIGLAEAGQLADAYQPREAESPPPQAAGPADIPLNDEPAKGSPDAPITIVEYSDYQCPFCRRHVLETMPQMQEFIDNGTVRYVFKDYPLHNIHPQAQKAHEAARCAREIGGDNAYWTMHDLLFANQDVWGSVPVPTHVPVLKELAAEMGLSQEVFDTCLDNGRYADSVNAEVSEGIQLGITGTPTFFINGQRLVGAQPFAVFQQAFDTLLEN